MSLSFLVPPWGSQVSSRRDIQYNPSSGLWVCPGVSSQLYMGGINPNPNPREVPRRHPYQRSTQPQQAPFSAKEQQDVLEAPHPLSEAEPCNRTGPMSAVCICSVILSVTLSLSLTAIFKTSHNQNQRLWKLISAT